MKKLEEKRIFITGRNGQLGKALVARYPDATAKGRDEFDITDINQVKAISWSDYDVIINAAAYVNADHSETKEGREMSWSANAVGPRNLAEVAIANNINLIHVSSEYVFDGTLQNHEEGEIFTPLSVYGQTKAAGDIAVSLVPKHYTLRTSWVIGEGHNFVKTMNNLANLRVDPKVVNDQFGRLTFASEIVRAIEHLLENDVESGTYNISNDGPIKSWAEIAAEVFELAGHDKSRVKFITTDEYKKDKQPFAPRPTYSDLNLLKIQKTGFESHDYEPLLKDYIDSLERS
ncbi:MAG: dTDP-4-dehydrorhamnose reductase [Candidatus Saccharibacteria bacterium]|nr:dTDP-4-dehydrorhamnose reductase [Candidatus Saccharibacteria bacterium]